MVRTAVKNGLRKLGYVVSQYDSRRDPLAVRTRFLESHGINLVLDVGANTGQFALQLLETGYSGSMISFEPLSAAYRTLSDVARHHVNWRVENCALGDKEDTAEINVAENSWSSSLLNILPTHVESAPDSAYIATERIQMRTLDALFPRYATAETRAFLKIDTQGFTMKVLDGGEQALEAILGLQVEMSLVPLYEGEPLIGEVVSFLQRRGFTLLFLMPGFIDNATGQQLQVDGLFFRL
ncbi:MAG: FkbM family methyltransferase [Nitrospira sp.]|nr:MAG: FkbM family methyltransferase [Nitrospira sp.]